MDDTPTPLLTGPEAPPAGTSPSPRRRRLPPSEWADWNDERLLDLRLADLDLRIQGSSLEPLIAQVRGELAERGLLFRPHFWLSDEWFSPDGVPGVAIPFYLAHPRLTRLEQSQMLEVEGGTPEWCLRILRHEMGHAVENAYGLRRQRRRRELFGLSSQKYPEYYTPKPYSKSFVLHLDSWYAQSHPDEDFAETFAVWLTPGSDWARRYQGWKALQKLEYMDELMKQLAGRPPVIATRVRVEPLSASRKTLREHYERLRGHYGVDEPDVYDRDLKRLFSNAPEQSGNPSAARFLTRLRKEARRVVGRFTHERQYTIDQVLGDMVDRCRELGLRVRGSEEDARREFLVLLTVQTMNYLHSGRHRLAL
jgi:Putative zinc-binding metallo-peptidase